MHFGPVKSVFGLSPFSLLSFLFFLSSLRYVFPSSVLYHQWISLQQPLQPMTVYSAHKAGRISCPRRLLSFVAFLYRDATRPSEVLATLSRAAWPLAACELQGRNLRRLPETWSLRVQSKLPVRPKGAYPEILHTIE